MTPPAKSTAPAQEFCGGIAPGHGQVSLYECRSGRGQATTSPGTLACRPFLPFRSAFSLAGPAAAATMTFHWQSRREAAMKTAVVKAFDKPLVIEDRPVPEPGPGQVLVRVEASGLCHTDIHSARGDWPIKPPLPFIPGHEAVGVVTRLGPGVTERGLGARVAVPWLGWACGACPYCVGGRETLCPDQRNTGYFI